MKFLSQIQPISLREQVVGQVRMAIIEGSLKPKDHITEVLLTDQLGVSRTPIREALILLEREGLVEFLPNRGSFVRAFNVQDIDEIFGMRTTLENYAAEMIIEQLTPPEWAELDAMIEQQRQQIARGDFKTVRNIDIQFHRSLIHKSEHVLLARSWEELVAQIAALLYMRAETLPDYDEYASIQDHQAIVAGYKAQDLAAVQSANRCINQRVAHECKRALALLEEAG